MTEQRVARPVGRPPLTDRRAMLTAARLIGFPTLTVGAVTEAVGVKYSTFYRHYPSLEALVTDMVDEVCAEAELPKPVGPWQTYLTDTCTGLFALLDRNPGLAETIVRLPVLAEGVLAVYRNMTDVLLDAGFDAEQADLGATTALELVAMTWLTDPQVGRSVDEQRAQPAWTWAARKVALLIKGLEADLTAR